MSLTTIEHKRCGGRAAPLSRPPRAATAGLAWGAMFPVAKHGLRHVASTDVDPLRPGLAFVALLAVVEGREAVRFDGRGPPLVLGSLGFAGFNLLTYVGLGSTRPQNAALMIATMPFPPCSAVGPRRRARGRADAPRDGRGLPGRGAVSRAASVRELDGGVGRRGARPAGRAGFVLYTRGAPNSRAGARCASPR